MHESFELLALQTIKFQLEQGFVSMLMNNHLPLMTIQETASEPSFLHRSGAGH